MTRYEALALLPGTFEVPDGALRAIHAGGMTALVRRKPAKSRALSATRRQVAREAADRQALLEAAMPLGPVLTIRPRVLLSDAELAALIAANAPRIEAAFDRLCGKTQFQVTISWAADKVLSRFRDRPELAEHFKAGLVRAHQLQASVYRLAAALGQEMRAMIAPAVDDLIDLPTGPDMLLNVVTLVQIDRTADLDAAIEAVDAIWTEGLSIRQIGPAPGASFALLDPRLVTRAEVDKALRRLSLDQPVSGDGLQAARRAALHADPTEAEAIRTAADVVAAASRAAAPFHLCRILSDDTGLTAAQTRKVA